MIEKLIDISLIRTSVSAIIRNGVVTLLVGIFALGVSLSLFETNTGNLLIFNCTGVTCNSSGNKHIQGDDARQIENLDLTLRLNSSNFTPHNGATSFGPSVNQGFRQIQFPSTNGNHRSVLVPMRLGSSPSFGYTTPEMHVNDTLRIKIVSSRELYIFINEKIAYTHRYSSPVFMVDPQNPIDLTNLINGSNLTIQHFSSSISIESGIRVRVFEFGMALIGILIALLTKKILSRIFQNQKSTSGFHFPIGLPLFFWIGSVGLWLMRPNDGTGATHLSPFAPTGPAFSDYFQVIQTGQQNHPYDLGASSYPPLGLLLGKILSFIPNTVSFVIIFSIGIGTVLLVQTLIPIENQKFGRLGKWLFFAISYPIIFAVIRGNFDLIAAALLFIGFLAAARKSVAISSIAFAFAISLKYWPVLFLLVLLKGRRWRIAVYSLVLAGLVTVVSLILLGYPLNSEGLHLLISPLSSVNSGDANELGYSYSLRTFIYFVHMALTGHNLIAPTARDISKSFAFLNSREGTILLWLTAEVLLWMILRSKSSSATYLYVCALALLIPSPTYTYRAVVLLFYFYLRSLESDTPKPIDPQSGSSHRFPVGVEMWLWVVIIAPTTFFYIKNSLVSTASFLQPLAILSLVFLEWRRERRVVYE